MSMYHNSKHDVKQVIVKNYMFQITYIIEGNWSHIINIISIKINKM